jgi:hypothetical protein
LPVLPVRSQTPPRKSPSGKSESPIRKMGVEKYATASRPPDCQDLCNASARPRRALLRRKKEEWSDWEERHRRQSCEGSSEPTAGVSEFQLGTPYRKRKNVRRLRCDPYFIYYRVRRENHLIEVMDFWYSARMEPNL